MKKIGHVVILGHNFNSILGLARYLGENGYEIGVIRTGIRHTKNPIKRIGVTPESKSKYIKKYIVADSMEPEYLSRLLIQEFITLGEKPILFPVDDVCARAIDEKMNDLIDYFYMPNINNTQGKIAELMDKGLQKKLAKESGFNVVDGWTVSIENGTFCIPDCIKYPCFAKSEVPFHGRKSVMKKCSSKEELEVLLGEVSKKYNNCTMLIEEFIPIEREYCIVGVCDREYVCIPDVIDEEMMGHGTHAGVTCFGRVLPSGSISEIQKPLNRFLSQLDFQGLFTIDILKSRDSYFFCELNLRIGGSGIAICAAGVDIAGLTADVLTGTRNYTMDNICNEMSFVSERPLLNDYVLKYISWSKYKELINRADFRFIYSKDDRAPYYYYGLFVVKQMLKRLIKR